MDNHKKLAQELLKADGIDPVNITESERAVFAEMLDQQSKPKPSKPIFRQKRLRIIMENMKIKIAAIGIAILILLGLIPFNGTNAFGKIVDEITTTLTRLKALVLDKEVSETKYVEREIDKAVEILTACTFYSSSEISSLEDFLKKQQISFLSSGFETGKYTVIPSNKVANLQGFLQSSSSYNIIASPTLLTYSGSEGMLAVVNMVGASITAVQDKNKQLILDFAFHNGQNGYEIKEVHLRDGELLLITGIEGVSDDLMTVLVASEVKKE